MLLDVGYVVDNIDPPYQGEKRVVFFAILALARMVIWVTRNKGLYDGAKISHSDLILFLLLELYTSYYSGLFSPLLVQRFRCQTVDHYRCYTNSTRLAVLIV